MFPESHQPKQKFQSGNVYRHVHRELDLYLMNVGCGLYGGRLYVVVVGFGRS